VPPQWREPRIVPYSEKEIPCPSSSSAGLTYDGLPAEAKERLEGLHVTHDYRSALLRSGHDYPIVAHPIVRTHRETGQQILWVNFSRPIQTFSDPAFLPETASRRVIPDVWPVSARSS
jgi:Taurine catabolism dioxygenase TauD, TfdA family